MKKKLIILFVILSSPVFGFVHGDNPRSDSSLTGFIGIVVESNVNTVYFSYPITGNNLAGRDAGGTGGKTGIIVPVSGFKCENRVARKDFLELLKASQHPYLSIELPQGSLYQLDYSDSGVLHDVMISIAGVTRAYDIDVSVENTRRDGRLFTGSIKVSLNDLGLTPPEKLFGMIKVKDEVIVKFGFGLQNPVITRK